MVHLRHGHLENELMTVGIDEEGAPTYCNTVSRWFPLGHDPLQGGHSLPHAGKGIRRHLCLKLDCTVHNLLK